MSDVRKFGGRGAGSVNELIISEESARHAEPSAVLHDVEAFVLTLLNCGKYARSDLPPATLGYGGLALYIGGVRGGGHAGFLDHHGTELFDSIKSGIALAGLSGSFGPIWSEYDAWIAAEGRRAPYTAEDKPTKLFGRKTEKLLRGLVPPDPDEIYFPEDAWRSPVLEDLDRRFNAVSSAAEAQLKRLVLALPNIRLLPSAAWKEELGQLAGA